MLFLSAPLLFPAFNKTDTIVILEKHIPCHGDSHTTSPLFLRVSGPLLTATFQYRNRGVSSNFHSAPLFTGHANESQYLVGTVSNRLIDKSSPFYYGDRLLSARHSNALPNHLSPDLLSLPIAEPQSEFNPSPSHFRPAPHLRQKPSNTSEPIQLQFRSAVVPRVFRENLLYQETKTHG